MKKFLLAGAFALALVGCATTPTTHLSQGKALADAWSAFDTASVTLDGLAKAGVLSPSEKATINTVGPEVEASLNAATTAYDNNSDATAAQNVATAVSLTTQLVAIAGAHK